MNPCIPSLFRADLSRRLWDGGGVIPPSIPSPRAPLGIALRKQIDWRWGIALSKYPKNVISIELKASSFLWHMSQTYRMRFYHPSDETHHIDWNFDWISRRLTDLTSIRYWLPNYPGHFCTTGAQLGCSCLFKAQIFEKWQHHLKIQNSMFLWPSLNLAWITVHNANAYNKHHVPHTGVLSLTGASHTS